MGGQLSLPVVVGILVIMSGCVSSITKPDWEVQGISTALVILPTPTVTLDDGVMTITGDVRRQPGMSGHISGSVEISVISSEGKVLVVLNALITPNPIPTEGRGESQYTASLGWIPPNTAMVRTNFIEGKP